MRPSSQHRPHGTNYRVDRTARKEPGQQYTVPAGMNSIVYLSDIPPSISKVMQNLPSVLSDYEVLVFSKWNSHLSDWIVCNVERRQ